MISNITFFCFSLKFFYDNPLGCILMAAIQVVMTAFTAWLMDKAGRRSLLMVSHICCCQGCIFLATITFYVRLAWIIHSNSHEIVSILQISSGGMAICLFLVGLAFFLEVISLRYLLSSIIPYNFCLWETNLKEYFEYWDQRA